MKKFIYSLIVIVFLALFFAAQSSEFMMKYYTYRLRHKKYASVSSKYGDLYAQCFLPKFRIEKPDFKLKYEKQADSANINLFLICDSYLIDHSLLFAFPMLKNYKTIHWDLRRVELNLPSKCRNILILETTERHFLRRFREIEKLQNKLKVQKTFTELLPNENIVYAKMFPKIEFFNKHINQNLEFLLFDNSFFLNLKEWKASLNYKLFNRIHEKVVLSTDGNYLFMKETVDKKFSTSSFYPVSDSIVKARVANINKVYSYFKNLGFDEVYLSIIPNSVSIVDYHRDKCNELIPRIQQHKELKMPVIDIYSRFKNETKPVFLQNDSHWNPYGFKLWIKEVENVLN